MNPTGTRESSITSSEDLIEKIRTEQADVLIVKADLVHEKVFQACNLRIVGCCRADPLNVSREAASERGIPIFYAPGRNAEAVADLTIGLLLCLARNIVSVHFGLKSGKIRFESPEDIFKLFNQYGGFELGKATVGLVGLGAVGRKVAERLRPFGSRVFVHDPYASDERALFKALEERRIQGAALDVFDEEPFQPDSPWLQLDNVICTPHLGGATRDAEKSLLASF